MTKKPPPHIPHRPSWNCSCKHCRRWQNAAKRMRDRARATTDRINARHREAVRRQLGLLIILLIVVPALACATFEIRKACRVQCEDKRGPVWSWSGGPTIPPDSWDDCMRTCEAKADGDRAGNP